MISFHPNPGSQGDHKSIFLFSAAICIFEAQDFPAGAKEAARIDVDFKVCGGTTGAEQTGPPPSKGKGILPSSKHQPSHFCRARSSWQVTLRTSAPQALLSCVVLEQLCLAWPSRAGAATAPTPPEPGKHLSRKHKATFTFLASPAAFPSCLSLPRQPQNQIPAQC